MKTLPKKSTANLRPFTLRLKEFSHTSTTKPLSTPLRHKIFIRSIIATVIIAFSAFIISYLNNKQNPSQALDADDLVISYPYLNSVAIQFDTTATVDWGDGTIESVSPPSLMVHNYASGYSGQLIRINGPNLSVQLCPNAQYSIILHQWGTSQYSSMHKMFSRCNQLEISDVNQPNTSSVEDMSYMFYGVSNIFGTGIAIHQLDTANVKNMQGMFMNSALSSIPILTNTSLVTDMSKMFFNARFFNSPIDFDTSSVTDMSYMFAEAQVFNQSLNFNTSRVENFAGMFANATSFNQPVSFDASSARNMCAMFAHYATFPIPYQPEDILNYCDNANYYDIAKGSGGSHFNSPVNFSNTSNVADVSYMFAGAGKFDQPLSLDTWNVITTKAMFAGATSFNSPINFSNTPNITDMSYMFKEAWKFNQPLNFNTENTKFMNHMFDSSLGAQWGSSEPSSFNQPLNFNTIKVIDMESMFHYASSFNQSIEHFDFSRILQGGYKTSLQNFLSHSGLSVVNYDKFISSLKPQVDFAAATVPVEFNSHNYPVGVDDMTYCIAEGDRTRMLADHSNLNLQGDRKDCSDYQISVSLDNHLLYENNSPGFMLSAIHVTSVLPTTLSLSCTNPGPDDTSFNIDNDTNMLYFLPVADYETKTHYSVCIKATNAVLSTESEFLIEILDIFDPAISIYLSASAIKFNFAPHELNSYKTDTITATVTTDNLHGSHLSLSALSSTTLRSTLPSNTMYIPTTNTTHPVSSLPENTWSFSLSNDTHTTPIPSSPTIIHNQNTNSTYAVNTNFYVNPGVNLLAGQYQATLVYTAIANP